MEKKNKIFICICIIILFIAFIIKYNIVYKQSKTTNNENIILTDTTYNKVTLDSIKYNIIKKDSTIYKLKKEVRYEIEKALNANDSVAIEQFKSLSAAE